MEGRATAVRLNPFKGLEGPQGDPVPWSPYGRMLKERPGFTLDPLFHAGCYYVQDSSAMYVGHVFRKVAGTLPGREAASGGRLRSPLKVLDLCAAPGGKTTDMAACLREMSGDGFELVSNEVMKARAAVLRDNVARWGEPNVLVTSVDPALIGRLLPGYFDIVVADVPCSGEGMFRKNARAEKEWSENIVALCAARQKRILADVWPALRQGGALIYSTCTYESAENDDNLAWAAATLGGGILPPEDEFPQSGVRLTPHGHLLRAGEVPGEGQWVGALIKTAPAPTRSAAGTEVLRPLPAEPMDSCLAINYSGREASVELNLQEALRYLHRDALYLPEAPLGLLVVRYKGHPLGYVKNLGSRCNNLLPKNRRILMDVKL